MNDEEIEAMAAQLEAEVRDADARFRIVQHGGDAMQMRIMSSRIAPDI